MLKRLNKTFPYIFLPGFCVLIITIRVLQLYSIESKKFEGTKAFELSKLETSIKNKLELYQVISEKIAEKIIDEGYEANPSKISHILKNVGASVSKNNSMNTTSPTGIYWFMNGKENIFIGQYGITNALGYFTLDQMAKIEKAYPLPFLHLDNVEGEPFVHLSTSFKNKNNKAIGSILIRIPLLNLLPSKLDVIKISSLYASTAIQTNSVALKQYSHHRSIKRNYFHTLAKTYVNEKINLLTFDPYDLKISVPSKDYIPLENTFVLIFKESWLYLCFMLTFYFFMRVITRRVAQRMHEDNAENINILNNEIYQQKETLAKRELEINYLTDINKLSKESKLECNKLSKILYERHKNDLDSQLQEIISLEKEISYSLSKQNNQKIINRLIALIKKLTSEEEMSQSSFQLLPLPVNDLINKVLHIVGFKARELQINLKVDIQNLERIHTDPYYFILAVANIINLSLERTPEKGAIQMVVSTDATNKAYFNLSIEDNGFNFDENEYYKLVQQKNLKHDSFWLPMLGWEELITLIGSLGGVFISNTHTNRTKKMIIRFPKRPIIKSQLPNNVITLSSKSSNE